MHYRKMSKNYIFRKFECGLSKEETAKLCFKTVRTVTGWDNGRDIPPECRRLMRMVKGRELSHIEAWKGFKINYEFLEVPTGERLTPQQILTGVALLQIQSELELKTTTKLLRIARKLATIKHKKI
ncbi:regulator [Vibrio sp. ABG19]|uniref:regulator n=1 Tax=Vibrio sp. ABG19 TaxID=2817385 RepID=UPI00249F07FD|nr:regulator [Vibrio sp. ABG19]WGY44998.1 phage protein [Vibrio sp. ABG19]